MFYQKYLFGDTAVYYTETPVEGHEGKTVIGLAAYPKDVEIDARTLCCDGLIQVAFSGDEALVDYTLGLTMRNRVSVLLSVVEQRADECGVVTRLTDGAGNYYTHMLRYYERSGIFSVCTEYENGTGDARTLEMLQSVSLSGIAAPSRGCKSTCGLTLHRLTSAWSRECRLKSEPFSALGLDTSWARYGVRCEKFGQVGSMPNRNYYPFAAIEDKEGGVCWGAQMEASYSWQMEVYEEKQTCALSGGLADYEFGHWRKEIPAGGKFRTREAFFCVVRGSLYVACDALVKEADARLAVPASEENMPVLFNEYCTTWGCPSEENIEKILRALNPFPIGTFVIDAGWYKPDDRGWCNAIGDWRESKSLFPAGIKRVADKIKQAGMNAGIWFEFEVAGRDSEYFHREDMLLKRDGALITAKNRRFLDLRKGEVREYLSERMLKFLQENGFTYLKIDYNDNIGMGCDGAESCGEGGRQIAEESLLWLDKIKNAVPEMVIENCSSGGSRIEPIRMSKVSMCSFSDAHECAEIPLVAANVSRVVPARQIQIWAVIRETDGISRIIYSVCAAMIGRICLSGDVLSLTHEKIDCIREGLDFYETIKEVVRFGKITEISSTVEYYREPRGRQVYVKDYKDDRLVIVHFLEDAEELVVSAAGCRLVGAYTDLHYSLTDGTLRIAAENFRAGAFLLKK